MIPILTLPTEEKFKIIVNVKTKAQGIECLICNKEIYDQSHVEKKYCPECNIYLEYTNYLSFI